MAKTRTDLIALSHRLLGVLATDETPTADQEKFAGDMLDVLIDEINAIHGVAVTFANYSFIPLARLLAAEIAPHYDVPAPNTAGAMARLLAGGLSDDRPAEEKSPDIEYF